MTPGRAEPATTGTLHPVVGSVYAADGRAIGARAHRTRQRLLDATSRLLAEQGILELRVVDVTRSVGASPATFYQYFADVDGAVLVLAEQAAADMAPLRAMLASSWHGPRSQAQATAFVREFRRYRVEHEAVLRVRDLKAEEGDARFRQARQHANLELMAEMVARVSESQAAGRVDAELNAYAAAGAMVAMMERLLAYEREFERRGVDPEAMVRTIALLLHETLVGTAA